MQVNYNTFLIVSGLYVVNICSKLVATLSFAIEESFIAFEDAEADVEFFIVTQIGKI